MKFQFALLIALVVFLPSIAFSKPLPVFQYPYAPVEARVNDLFSRLTEKEKLSLLSGTDFTSQPIPRLGLKGIAFADAGQGVRGGSRTTVGPATAFPSETIMASTWDSNLLREIGKAIGQEARNKGTGVQMELGPAVNIHRTPYGGRNGEYMSEDPYIAGRLAVAFIEGLQSTGVDSCIKHFACNNQEDDREKVNVQIGTRALREIYLPAFEAAVTEGHVDAIMPAYNKVNGQFCAQNPFLLRNVLRKDWGFNGVALSDWGAVHSTGPSVNGGTDLEMPGPGANVAKNLQIELKNGHITQSTIDGAVRNILRAMIRAGLADGVEPKPNPAVVGELAHRQLAYKAAVEGIVLLKNAGNVLPLNPYAQQTIAIIGSRAKDWQIDAGGSPKVDPTIEVSAYHGIVHRLSTNTSSTVTYTPADDFVAKAIPTSALTTADGKKPGLTGAYFNNNQLSGKPYVTRVDPVVQFLWNKTNRPSALGAYHCSIRWTGYITPPTTGEYVISLNNDDGGRVWLGGKAIVSHWEDGAPKPRNANVYLVAGKAYPVRVEYYQGWAGHTVNLNWLLPFGSKKPFAAAAQAAANANAAIVFVGSQPEAEADDRSTIQLDEHEELLVKTVAAANPHTVVVLNNGGALLLGEWINSVPAVVEAGFPGELGGNALASILFGDVSPSGKLVDTYAARRQDYPDFGHYPGVKHQVKYAEGVYVGYRAFDKRNIAPLFPFGYGLSYTQFRYSNINISNPNWDTNGTLTVTADVTNVGTVLGDEIAELYVEPVNPLVDRPTRELKGFDRLHLEPAQTATATFTINQRALAYFDVPGSQWRADQGQYVIEVGGSSRDLPLHTLLTTTKTWTQYVP